LIVEPYDQEERKTLLSFNNICIDDLTGYV
jgi:hypothetical protein